MKSTNTKEMKMLFENWRKHTNIIVEGENDPWSDQRGP